MFIHCIDFYIVQRVKELYKDKYVENGPSVQYYMMYTAEEINLSYYCGEKNALVNLSTYGETSKWCIVDDSKPLQV